MAAELELDDASEIVVRTFEASWAAILDLDWSVVSDEELLTRCAVSIGWSARSRPGVAPS